MIHLYVGVLHDSDSGGLSAFEEKIKEKAASEAGAAFFDIRYSFFGRQRICV